MGRVVYYVDQDGLVQSFFKDNCEHRRVVDSDVFVINKDLEVVGEFTAYESLTELAKVIEC